MENEAADRDCIIPGAAPRERFTVINLPMQGLQMGCKDMVEVHVLGLLCFACRALSGAKWPMMFLLGRPDVSGHQSCLGLHHKRRDLEEGLTVVSAGRLA